MTIFHDFTRQELKIARLGARIISLVMGGYVLSIILFNEDIRAEPGLPVILMVA